MSVEKSLLDKDKINDYDLTDSIDSNFGELVVFKNKEEYKFEKIYKSNSIIYGKTNKKSPAKLYAKDLKILNFFYKLLEEAIRQRKEPPKGAVTLQFPLEIYRLIVDDQKNWKRVFISSIKRLEEIKFELENYYNPISKEKIKYQSTRLLAFPKFYSIGENLDKNDEEISVDIKDEYGKDIGITVKGVDIFQATFSEEIATCCWQKTNYTHLSFKTINTLQNKFSIKFYEILVSKLQMNANYMDSSSEIILDKKELSIVFDNAFNQNINLSNFLTNIVNFDNVILPELKEHLDIEKYEVFQKSYSICFYFSKKTINKFRTQETTPYMLELEKFSNLLSSNEHIASTKSAIVDSTSTLYTFDANAINKALENFLLILNQEYCDIELLKTDREKAKFGGNVIMTFNQGFVYKDNGYKRVPKSRQENILKHLYRHYYVEIMTNIEHKKIERFAVENKEEINSLFLPYLNQMVLLGDSEHIGKVKHIKMDTDSRLEVIFDMYQKNSLMSPTSSFVKTFENILFFTDYLLKNKFEVK